MHQMQLHHHDKMINISFRKDISKTKCCLNDDNDITELSVGMINLKNLTMLLSKADKIKNKRQNL